MIANFALHIDRDWVFVSEQENIVAGYAILLTKQREALLDNIAVDPAFQRSGMGEALVGQVEKRTIELGYAALDLYTNVIMSDNVRWYEKLGFVETRRVEEAGFRRIYMRKVLSAKR